MYTRKALQTLLTNITSDLDALGIDCDKFILFGSYAKGNVHEYSDVDIALWSDAFTGSIIDLEVVRPLLRKYKGLDIKMYPSMATADNFDPFIEEIERTGILVFSKASLPIARLYF